MTTAAAFLDMLPQFAGVSTSTIDVWLGEAARMVTAEYGVDQDRATILLAAHQMSLTGLGPEAGAGAFAGVKSMTSGSLSFTKDDKLGDWGLTSFGRLFYPLMRSYRAGPFVTGTGYLPGDPWTGPYHGRNDGGVFDAQ